MIVMYYFYLILFHSQITPVRPFSPDGPGGPVLPTGPTSPVRPGGPTGPGFPLLPCLPCTPGSPFSPKNGFIQISDVENDHMLQCCQAESLKPKTVTLVCFNLSSFTTFPNSGRGTLETFLTGVHVNGI